MLYNNNTNNGLMQGLTMQQIALNKYPSFVKAPDVNLICEPLTSNSPIKVIEYSRVYLDGSRLELSNNQEITKNSIISCSNIIKHVYTPALIPKYQRYLLMAPWVAKLENSASQILMDRINKQREKHEIGNEFRIIITHPTYTEMFHFYSDKNTINMENFYLNNINLLEQFILYFLDKAHDIINDVDKKKVIQPWRNSGSSIIMLDKYSNTTQTVNKALEPSKTLPSQFSIKKFRFQSNGIDIYLTKREIDCMLQIIQNKSNKEIAECLFVSIRTVETHVSSLLNKTNSTSRRELVSFFSKRGLSRLISHV